jgi:hypothetical protein
MTFARSATKQLRNLKPGTAFIVETEPGRIITGQLLYVNQCRARVRLDGPKQIREFTSKHTGQVIRFEAPGSRETSWPIEMEVEVEL